MTRNAEKIRTYRDKCRAKGICTRCYKFFVYKTAKKEYSKCFDCLRRCAQIERAKDAKSSREN